MGSLTGSKGKAVENVLFRNKNDEDGCREEDAKENRKIEESGGDYLGKCHGCC